MTCMGLSTLRNTFITWNRHTGAPLHNFIVWKDLRSAKLCKEWNKSVTMRSFNFYNRMLYTLKRCNRTLSAAHFKLVPGTPAAGNDRPGSNLLELNLPPPGQTNQALFFLLPSRPPMVDPEQ